MRPYEIELIRRDYVANGGWETFLSYEDPDQDILVGLLRLRKLSDEVFRWYINLKLEQIFPQVAHKWQVEKKEKLDRTYMQWS